jgi:hypothetical protein
VYSEEKTSGLVKNYLYQIMLLLVRRMDEIEMKSLAVWMIDDGK